MADARDDRILNRLDEALGTLRGEFELNRREFELNRQAQANGRTVLAELSTQIRASVEENRRHNDAVVGALTDLATEIRGWGSGPAAV